jgi:RNA polymerase sigma-70 factor, ECF subfamily
MGSSSPRLRTRSEPCDADAAMNRYADGDDAAFEDVYEQLAPRLFAFAMHQTHEREIAEDLVQQTFLRLHRERGHFVRGARVLPWAFAIVRHLIIDGGRRRHFEAPPREHRADADPRPSDDALADDVIAAKQLAAGLETELARMPQGQRVAFELVREEGLSYAEAAEVLGTTVTAIKLRVHRAYEALRGVIGDWSQGEGEDP